MHPILAPDQSGVARPLQPEDLDTRVTRQGIYPSLPAPNGVPWSEYISVQRNRTIFYLHTRLLLKPLNQTKQGMLLER